jgi:hypothetical protein
MVLLSMSHKRQQLQVHGNSSASAIDDLITITVNTPTSITHANTVAGTKSYPVLFG